MRKSLKKSLVLILGMLMVIGFSSLASAALITFNVNTTQPINIGETFTVDISVVDTEKYLGITSFALFVDYNENYISFMDFSPYPTWDNDSPFESDFGKAVPEPDSGWYTVAGWSVKGYTAPANFEEGPDMLVLDFLDFGSFEHTADAGDPVILGTLTFQCVGPGDSFLLAMNRPDGDYVVGTIGDNDIAWDASLTTLSAVPIPGAVLLFGSGLLGLLGIGIRRKTKK